MRTAVLLLLCSCHEQTASTTILQPPAPETICALARARLDGWHGMPTVPLDAGLSCLGVPIARGIDAKLGFRYFVAFRLEGFDVRLLGIRSRTSLVEIVPQRPLDARALNIGLPTPDTSLPTGERVYPTLGLALLVRTTTDGTELVARIRGFAPMSVALYNERFGPRQRLGFP